MLPFVTTCSSLELNSPLVAPTLYVPFFWRAVPGFEISSPLRGIIACPNCDPPWCERPFERPVVIRSRMVLWKRGFMAGIVVRTMYALLIFDQDLTWNWGTDNGDVHFNHWPYINGCSVVKWIFWLGVESDSVQSNEAMNMSAKWVGVWSVRRRTLQGRRGLPRQR